MNDTPVRKQIGYWVSVSEGESEECYVGRTDEQKNWMIRDLGLTKSNTEVLTPTLMDYSYYGNT